MKFYFYNFIIKMITPVRTILNEISDINSFIKKYPYSENLLNSRLNVLQNKIKFINKYTYLTHSGQIQYDYYNSDIINWSKEKLKEKLNELEETDWPEGGNQLENKKALIRKVIKERVLKDFINNHLKIKYTNKIVKEKVIKDNKKIDDYELIEVY